MGEALYRKYRSKKLDEIVGQKHVTTTLQNALKSGKISHAYLLTGPRGTGKTSIARILAHEVNNLPYSDTQHLDIIEIDAASNRRIDEVRDIRDKVRLAPTSATYKVYIIDEVHMLTKEAFNALLKTLEEPPKHAIFILATTEAHKLPETIISRTQRFNLKPIASSDMVNHLRIIAKAEKVSASDEALELIATHSNGGLRDAISLFDQLASHQDSIEADDVRSMLGVAPNESILQLHNAINRGSPKEVTTLLSQLEDQGFHSPQIAHQLSEIVREALVSGNTDSPQTTIALLHDLVNVPQAPNPQRALELALLGYALITNPQPKNTTPQPPQAQKSQPKSVAAEEIPAEQPEKPDEITPQVTDVIELGEEMSSDDWNAILQAVKKKHNTLYGIVRMAKPTLSEKTLTLVFSFPFHQKRMNEAKNKQLIADVIKEATGQNLTIVCIGSNQVEVPQPSKPVQASSESGTLDTITDIFGGGEVLES